MITKLLSDLIQLGLVPFTWQQHTRFVTKRDATQKRLNETDTTLKHIISASSACICYISDFLQPGKNFMLAQRHFVSFFAGAAHF